MVSPVPRGGPALLFSAIPAGIGAGPFPRRMRGLGRISTALFKLTHYPQPRQKPAAEVLGAPMPTPPCSKGGKRGRGNPSATPSFDTATAPRSGDRRRRRRIMIALGRALG